MKKQPAKLIALLMAAVMLFGAAACSATEDNPVIGRIGKVKITFDQYQSIFQQNYYSYMFGGSSSVDINEYIKEQLITYGVTLNHCYEAGIELSDEEIAEKVDEQIDSVLTNYKAAPDLLDKDAIREDKLRQLKEELEKNDLTFEEYKENIIENYREQWLMDKLRDQVYDEVTIDDDEVKKYYDEHIEEDRKKYGDDAENAIDDFYTAFTAYVQETGILPLYTPKDMFTVKHMYVGFEKSVDNPKDGTLSEDAQKLVDKTIELIKDESTTLADFENFVELKSEDYGMQEDCYIKHGYIMSEELIDKYYDGFGYAAMKLYAGKDWEPVEEEEEEKTDGTPNPDATPTAEPTPTATPAASPSPTPEPKTYDVEYYTLSDGTEIASVRSGSGIHFIYIKEKLESGDVAFEDNPDNAVWQDIRDGRLRELQEDHYTDCYSAWKAETKIRMKDDYIDQIASRLYGI